MKNKVVVFFDATPVWSGGAGRILFLAGEILKSGYSPRIVCLPGSRLESLAAGAGIETFAVKPLADLDPVALARVFLYLKKTDASVVDINSPAFYWIASMAAGWLGVRTILTRNVPYRKKGLKKILNRHLLYRRLDRVISLSAAVKKELEDDYGISTVRLIYDGIFTRMVPPSPADGASAKRSFGFGDGDLVFGSVGRLEKNKGQHIAVEAFGLIAGRFPAARLLVAGSGRVGYAAFLADLVRRKKLEGRVALTGYVGDVSAVYRATDILVHPSFYDNIPISILEAFACARPVVASRVGGIPEIIEEGVNGMLFAPGDVRELAAKMAAMASSDHAAMGRAALALAADKFSVDKMKSGYTALLDELIAEAK